MKTLLSIFAALLTTAGLHATDIPSAQKRAESLTLVQSLLRPVPPPVLTSDDIARQNPFSPYVPPVVVEQPADEPTPVQINNHEKLVRLAAQITPTGTVQIGGASILLIGQKKFKVGDKIPITFEDAIYDVEIKAIERTSFTVRLKDEEFTRPIKSATAPAPANAPIKQP